MHYYDETQLQKARKMADAAKIGKDLSIKNNFDSTRTGIAFTLQNW